MIETRRRMKMEMQYSITNSFILFSLFISVLSIITFPGVSAAPDLIADVCSETKYPNMCLEVLLYDRTTNRAASLHQLGEASVNLSISGAQTTKRAIKRLLFVTINKTHRAQLKSCLTTYDSALYYLGTAANYWRSGKFQEVARLAAAAMNEPITCRGYFAGGKWLQPRFLGEGNNELETLCRVVVVVSKRLSPESLSVSDDDGLINI